MKKYILTSQSYPIFETLDKELAEKYMESENEEHDKWVEECINNFEPYDSSQRIEMFEEEATEEDILRLFKEQNETITRHINEGYNRASGYLESVRGYILEFEPDKERLLKYIQELQTDLSKDKERFLNE